MKIVNVVGARPNFVKIAPLLQEMRRERRMQPFLVHTGQHYDYEMSEIFLRELEIPRPDVFLAVGSGSHAVQTARIMVRFEKVCQEFKPNLVLVVGDVNSTVACALVAAKAGIPLAHVEAGLRSFDRAMPEEINRVVTDRLADHLFATSRHAVANLRREGIRPERIHLVGNVMIDSLLKWKQKARSARKVEELGLRRGEYALLTLHRPSNVDSARTLGNIITALEKLEKRIPIVFPAHLRTRKGMSRSGAEARLRALRNVSLIPPLSYLSFLNLMLHCRMVLTDSGGIQEETTVLGIPCLTLRSNTERPETVSQGTNVIVGTDPRAILAQASRILDGRTVKRRRQRPPLWDGRTSRRIVAVLRTAYCS